MTNNQNRNVLIIQRRMTRYRIPLFEQMRARLSESGIRLHIVSGTPTVEEAQKRDNAILPWALTIPCRYWRVHKVIVVYQPIPEKLIRNQDLVIITQENSLIYNYWLLLRRNFSKPMVAFWGHGANFQAACPDSFSEKLKQWMSNRVDWWFAYTQLSVAKIIQNGFPASRITCLNNAIDTNELISFRQSVSPAESEALRTKLGLRGKHVGVFIGSLYPEKRLDFLLLTADKIKQHLPDFELIIIGDGAQRTLVIKAAKTRNWIHWVGVRYGYEKALYASLGQIMLNPGLVGLGISDSFALQLPMVTTDCRIHSPEIAYLDSGNNGLMTENNLQAFSAGVTKLFNDESLRNVMVLQGENHSVQYGLDQMNKRFCEGIIAALSHNQ